MMAFFCATYYLVLSSLFIADLDLHLSFSFSFFFTKGFCWVKMRQWCTDDSGGVPCDGCGLPALFFMFCLVMEGALFQVLCWSLEGDLFELYFNLDLDRGNPVFGRVLNSDVAARSIGCS